MSDAKDPKERITLTVSARSRAVLAGGYAIAEYLRANPEVLKELTREIGGLNGRAVCVRVSAAPAVMQALGGLDNKYFRNYRRGVSAHLIDLLLFAVEEAERDKEMF